MLILSLPPSLPPSPSPLPQLNQICYCHLTFQHALFLPPSIIFYSSQHQLAHVHFEGWSSRFDEWISLSSTGSRLRPILRQSQRRDSEKSKRSHSDPRTDFYVGEIVLARWTDCRFLKASPIQGTGRGKEGRIPKLGFVSCKFVAFAVAKLGPDEDPHIR